MRTMQTGSIFTSIASVLKVCVLLVDEREMKALILPINLSNFDNENGSKSLFFDLLFQFRFHLHIYNWQ